MYNVCFFSFFFVKLKGFILIFFYFANGLINIVHTICTVHYVPHTIVHLINIDQLMIYVSPDNVNAYVTYDPTCKIAHL